MVQLTFHQTKAEMMVRSAATLIFNALVRSGKPLAPLSALAQEPQYGYTASAAAESVGPKFVRITDLQDAGVQWDTVPYCICPGPESYLLRAGDVLFARTGATTGKTYLVSDPPDAVFASYLIRVRPRNGVLPEYLYSFFQSDQYWAQISIEKEGSAQPNINGRKLMSIALPIIESPVQSAIASFLHAVRKRNQGDAVELPPLPPPLDEQRRIVARIEALAAKIEEGRGLRKGVMELASALLASASDSVFKQKPGWKGLRVGDFCDHPQYGYTESATVDPVGPRFLRITDIQDGKVDWDTTPYCRCPNPKQYSLQKNDIVFARTGATTGKSFLIATCPEAVFASYLIRLRVQKCVTPGYLYRYFQTPSYWSQIRDEKKGTGQPNVNGRKLSNIRVPIPPPEEQRHIVAYLDGLQAKVDTLKKLQSETAAEIDALLPSILDKAFKGEL